MRITAAAQAPANRRRTCARRAHRGALAAPVTSSSPLRRNSAPLPVTSPSTPKLPTGVSPDPRDAGAPEPFGAGVEAPGVGVVTAASTCHVMVRPAVPDASLTACTLAKAAP